MLSIAVIPSATCGLLGAIIISVNMQKGNENMGLVNDQ